MKPFRKAFKTQLYYETPPCKPILLRGRLSLMIHHRFSWELDELDVAVPFPPDPPSLLVARGGQGHLRSRGPWPRGTRGPGPLSWKASNGHTIGADTTVPLLRSFLSNSWLRNFHGFRIMIAFAILEFTWARWHQTVATIALSTQFCFRMV